MSQAYVDIIEARQTISAEDQDREEHWTEYRPKWYEELLPKWKTSWDHYQAALDVLRSRKYLIQRVQGESDAQYKERLLTSDYLPLFATTVDSLVGRMLAIEPFGRRWQLDDMDRGLGRVENPDSHAYDFYHNVDGKGTSLLNFIEDVAIRTIVFDKMWVWVNGIEWDDTGEMVMGPKVQLIEPAAVVGVLEDEDGNPLEVLVESEAEGRKSLRERDSKVLTYTLFTVEGTVTVTHTPKTDEDGRETMEIKEEPLEPYGEDGRPFHYYRSKRLKKKRLPIFPVQMPLRRYVGHTLAEKNGVVFNQESERDNILRIACTPLFVFVGSNDQFKEATSKREKGWNAIQLDPQAARQHYYASPDTSAAELRSNVLRDKIADYFVSAFRFYEDSVRGKQKTATEIGQDAASGEGSFLNTLANTLDGMENQIGFLLEQSLFPNDPSVWGQYQCMRPKDFKPLSPVEEGRQLADIFFGKNPVPLDASGQLDVIRKIAANYNIEFSDDDTLLVLKEKLEAVAKEEKASAEQAEAEAEAAGEETEPVVPVPPTVTEEVEA